jgi:hypothetical protein
MNADLQVKLFDDAVVEAAGRDAVSEVDQSVQSLVLVLGQELKAVKNGLRVISLRSKRFCTRPVGTDVMIFKIFSPKNLANNWRFLLKTKLNYAKNMIIILVFEKTPNFSQKIVIITSTPEVDFTNPKTFLTVLLPRNQISQFHATFGRISLQNQHRTRG